jgi:hypothetical protein
MVEFVKHVFAATGDYRRDMPSVISIGDSMIMISEAGIRKPTASFLYAYVADTDEAYRQALPAGARSLEEPTNVPYGDRRGMFEDQWVILGRSLHTLDTAIAEVLGRRLPAHFHIKELVAVFLSLPTIPAQAPQAVVLAVLWP